MSFSQDVREELIRHYTKQERSQKAELAALLIFNSKGLALDTETGKFIYTDVRNTDKEVFTQQRKTFNINKMADLDSDIEKLISKPDEKRAFLRGAFIGAGTISDPNTGYHFEIAAPDEWAAKLILEILKYFSIPARIYKNHTGRCVVYVKDSEAISLALTVMEANYSMMEFENIHIEREIRGNTNRRVNCDTANINKTISAGAKQIRDIELIDRCVGLENIDEGLQTAARARLENPDASLTELGELLMPPLGKSGINHRMRKISALAEKLRSKQK